MPKSGMFRFFFKPKKWHVFLLVRQFIINRCVGRRHTTSQIGNTHEYTVRRHIRCLPRASGIIVGASGPSMVSLFRLVRSCLFCNSGFRLHLGVRRPSPRWDRHTQERASAWTHRTTVHGNKRTAKRKTLVSQSSGACLKKSRGGVGRETRGGLCDVPA